MAIFNVNQNRQLYVAKAAKKKADVTDLKTLVEGDILMNKTEDGKQFWFNHVGKGGLSRTDLIDVDKVCYVKVTTKDKMQRKPKIAKVSLSADVNGGKPISGQDYILRIQINNYLAPGDACKLIKSSAVHATRAMVDDTAAFYEKLKNSLVLNFKRENELNEVLQFESDATGVTIKEAPNQPWRLGVLSQEPVNFEVIPTTVTWEGDEYVWATTNEDGFIPVKEDPDGTPINNGTKVADLEYFCQAERGDMFRNMGWPNNIDVKYMVDPTKGYDMLDIHFFYSGSGVQNHKSEKDITIVSSEAGVINSIKTDIAGLGITVTE